LGNFMKRLVLGLVAVLPLAAPALADDSTAMLGAGGVMLTQNADIRMATEDLYLSPKAVKVRYTFTNDSGKDVDTVVAFPLPDVDNYELSESPIGTTSGSTPNFVGFRLTVDGKPVAATPDERAMLNGKDVTAQVRAASLPLNIVIGGGYDKLQKLPRPVHDSLIKAGLIDGAGGDDPVHAKWTTQTKFWWKMHFPAGKTVTVDHAYQPVTGQSFFGPNVFTDKEQNAYYARFCIDASTRSAIDTRLAALKKKTGGEAMLNQYTTDFVIKTANNWKGPIGKFHLTVDKLKPDSILSLCWGPDLKKTGPTTFEATRMGFAPKQDIQILVLENPAL
jgi:Domain of unknown function (DUF4424)